MGLMKDFDIRIRNGGDDAIAAVGELTAHLEGEVERLRSLTRFQDRVIRSGDTACLTQEERLSIQWVIGEALAVDGVSIQATLRGLLERTQ